MLMIWKFLFGKQLNNQITKNKSQIPNLQIPKQSSSIGNLESVSLESGTSISIESVSLESEIFIENFWFLKWLHYFSFSHLKSHLPSLSLPYENPQHNFALHFHHCFFFLLARRKAACAGERKWIVRLYQREWQLFHKT